MNEPGSPTKRKHDSAGLKRSVLAGTPCSDEASAATPGTSVKPAATQGTRARPTETLSVKSKCALEVIVTECNKGDPFVKCGRCGKQNRQGKAFCLHLWPDSGRSVTDDSMHTITTFKTLPVRVLRSRGERTCCNKQNREQTTVLHEIITFEPREKELR